MTHEEGDYRIDVERDLTAVSTRRGVADIYGQDVAYRIDRRERFAFYTPDLRDYDAGPLPPPDAFDRWARERAQREDRSASSRYVSPELVGYVDLDGHGDWRIDATYGNVWVPRVDVNWAPYRYGNWTWVDPWGWTWVDDAPWGYAPSHYGRWTQLGRTWAWVPGPRNVRPVVLAGAGRVGRRRQFLADGLLGSHAGCRLVPACPRRGLAPVVRRVA